MTTVISGKMSNAVTFVGIGQYKGQRNQKTIKYLPKGKKYPEPLVSRLDQNHKVL